MPGWVGRMNIIHSRNGKELALHLIDNTGDLDSVVCRPVVVGSKNKISLAQIEVRFVQNPKDPYVIDF